MEKLRLWLKNYLEIAIVLIFAIFLGIYLISYIGIYSPTFITESSSNFIIALGSILSVTGFFAFSTLMYKLNQLDIFQNEFNILLQEHRHLLYNTFYVDNKLKLEINFLVRELIRESIRKGKIEKFYPYDNGISSQYFILLYRILEVIDDSPKAKKYADIIRVLIPNEIMFLVAFNVLNDKYKEYKHLFIKYNLLEHLAFDLEYIKFILGNKNTFEDEDIKIFMKEFIQSLSKSTFGDNIYIK